MKSCFLVLMVVVCVAVAEGQNCFKDGELDKQWKEAMMKVNEPVIKTCKGKKADMSGDELEKCVKGEWGAAIEGCKAESGDDKHKLMKCAKKKLGVVCDMKFADFKTQTLEMVLPDKKKAVEDAITPCEKEQGEAADLKCGMNKLSELCPDVKERMEKLKKEWLE